MCDVSVHSSTVRVGRDYFCHQAEVFIGECVCGGEGLKVLGVEAVVVGEVDDAPNGASQLLLGF